MFFLYVLMELELGSQNTNRILFVLCHSKPGYETAEDWSPSTLKTGVTYMLFICLSLIYCFLSS